VSRTLSILLLVIVVAAAGLFYAAPVITFYDIRSACQSQDVQSLAREVDFDRVRTSLRTQLDAGDQGIAAPPPNAMSDPAGATGDALSKVAKSIGDAYNNLVNPKAGKTPPKPVIDANSYLTPRALLALTDGLGKDAATATAAALPAKAPMPKIAFFSLEHARLTVKDAAHGTTTFTFERHGLTHWQLVHVGLPVPGQQDGGTSSSSPADGF